MIHMKFEKINVFNKTKVLYIKDIYKYGAKELIAVLEFKIPSL